MTDITYANTAITAHAARFMLTQGVIRSLVNSASVAVAVSLLENLGYSITGKTGMSDDDIIDAERKRALDTFLEFCPDTALENCVKSEYDFIMKKIPKKTTYTEYEKELYEKISVQVPKIRDKNIQVYFIAELEAFNKGMKTPEELLFKLAKECQNDFDTLGPVFFWYILKQSEFKVIKAVLMGKRFEFSREKIMDMIGGLYERFK